MDDLRFERSSDLGFMVFGPDYIRCQGVAKTGEFDHHHQQQQSFNPQLRFSSLSLRAPVNWIHWEFYILCSITLNLSFQIAALTFT